MEYYIETRKHPSITINARDLRYLPHLHQEAEIITVIRGEVTLTLSGQQHILRAGDAALIQPNRIHSYESSDSHSLLTIFRRR